MSKSQFSFVALAALTGGFVLSAVAGAFAGTEERASKEVAAQAAKEPFPIHISLTAGIDKQFVFRGVDILPEKTLDVRKASNIAINSLPAFRQFILAAGFPSVDDFVKLNGFPRSERVARESGIGYFDGNLSYTYKATTLTAGAFYALQDQPRIQPRALGGESFFTEYRELDAYLVASHTFGPLTLSLGGTYYHVEKNSQFDTAEMNFGVFYTPPQLNNYVTLSFSYDYARAFNYDADDLDGHHLEFKIGGNVPVPLPIVKKGVVSFNPYVLFSAGAGIVPRAFNRLTLPTYFSNELFAAALAPVYQNLFNNIVNNQPADSSAAIARARGAIDPSALDRDFDLSNFQVGFKVPIYLTRHITFTGNGNYTRALGNLNRAPYNQTDVIWGGVNLNFTY